MDLNSSAYTDGGTMPARFATVNVSGGTGASIPFGWSAVPPDTESFVLGLIDTHPVAHGWVHWLVTDIPSEVSALAEGASMTPAMPAGAVEHPNTGGRRGYGGPQPPAGSGVHDYVAHVYALDVPHLAVGGDALWEEVRTALSGHVLDTATFVGRLGR